MSSEQADIRLEAPMRQPTTDTPRNPDPEPAQRRLEMDLPGADHPDRRPDQPDAPDADLPQRLGERIASGPGGAVASGEPDLLPDVDVPEGTM
jgi:hypothetical protein